MEGFGAALMSGVEEQVSHWIWVLLESLIGRGSVIGSNSYNKGKMRSGGEWKYEGLLK